MSNVTVKVEVWDVVDKGKPKGKPGTLRINFEEEVNVSAVSPNGAAGGDLRLDAETIDVMKGTHAVIFMVDPTKKWTFDYVRREMPKVPPNVWVLIVVCRHRSSCCCCCCCSLTHSRACKSQSNYKDLDDKRVVTDYEIKEFARECGSHVVAAEASMLNRFGVKAIKTFFNLPFLQMEVRRDRARMHAFNRLDRQSMAHRHHYHLLFHHSATFSRSSSDAIRRRSRSLSKRSRS